LISNHPKQAACYGRSVSSSFNRSSELHHMFMF